MNCVACLLLKSLKFKVKNVSIGIFLFSTSSFKIHFRFSGHYESQEKSCDPETRPDSTTRCFKGPCPTIKVPKFFDFSKSFSWNTSSWSSCSATCGPSEKKRAVYCIDNDGMKSSNSYCNISLRPGLDMLFIE